MTAAEIAAYSVMGITLVLIIIFMVIVPLLRKDAIKKERNKHEIFINNLKAGSKVVLVGGLYGTLISIDYKDAEIEIAEKIIVKIDKYAIVSKQKQK